MASRTAAYGRAAYHWAVKRGSLAVNPFANLPQAPLARRERVLADEGLRAVWRATEEPGPFDAIVRMLILTGQRREEAAGMTWHKPSTLICRTWSIPGSRAKNGITHIVPLPSQAQALLRTQPRHEGRQEPRVSRRERGLFAAGANQRIASTSECGVSDWTLHDLRRTAATGLQKLGVRLEVTEAVLNHVAGSRAEIVGVYQRHHWADEKRTAHCPPGASMSPRSSRIVRRPTT